MLLRREQDGAFDTTTVILWDGAIDHSDSHELDV
jgi:hypothetical protein